jgi:hypothetical protein
MLHQVKSDLFSFIEKNQSATILKLLFENKPNEVVVGGGCKSFLLLIMLHFLFIGNLSFSSHVSTVISLRNGRS